MMSTSNGHNHRLDDLADELHEQEVERVKDRALLEQIAADVSEMKSDHEELKLKVVKFETALKVAKFLVPLLAGDTLVHLIRSVVSAVGG